MPPLWLAAILLHFLKFSFLLFILGVTLILHSLVASHGGSVCGLESTFKVQIVFKSTMTFTFFLALSVLSCTCAQPSSKPGTCEELGLCWRLYVCVASLVSKVV